MFTLDAVRFAIHLSDKPARVMKYPIKVNLLTQDLEFHDEIASLLVVAKNYLNNHNWCRKILDGWLFINIGYALNVYLFDIENSQSPYDNLIWVMVGDFPPVYLDTTNVLTTKEVIEAYVNLAEEWIATAERRELLDDCFPFEVEVDEFELFKSKVRNLKTLLMPNIDEIHFKVALNQ